MYCKLLLRPQPHLSTTGRKQAIRLSHNHDIIRKIALPLGQKKRNPISRLGKNGFTFLTDASFDLTKADSLNQIKTAIRSMNFGDDLRSDRHMVLLVTPKFLPLVQDAQHLPKMLAEQALRTCKSDEKSTSAQITIAAIDRIPFPKLEWLSEPPLDTSIASLWGAEGITVTNMLKPSRLLTSEPAGTIGIATGIIRRRPMPTSEFYVSRGMAFKLAKTMMLTGQSHFLKQEFWKKEFGKGLTVVQKSDERDLESCFFQLVRNPYFSYHVALRQGSTVLSTLTAPRKVLSAFGNVIKSFESQNDPTKHLPASKELEDVLPGLAKELARKPEVWALVMPQNLLADYYSYFSQPDFRNHILNFINAGARFYLVSGGGGGWDGPGGPVSLDVDGDPLDMPEGFRPPLSFQNMSPVKQGDFVVFMAPLIRNETRRTVIKMRSNLPEADFYFGSRPAKEGWDPVVPTEPQVIYDYFAALSEQLCYTMEARLPDNKASYGSLLGKEASKLPDFSGFQFTPNSEKKARSAASRSAT